MTKLCQYDAPECAQPQRSHCKWPLTQLDTTQCDIFLFKGVKIVTITHSVPKGAYSQVVGARSSKRRKDRLNTRCLRCPWKVVIKLPSPRAECNTRCIFQSSSAGLHKEFSFCETGFTSKTKETRLPWRGMRKWLLILQNCLHSGRLSSCMAFLIKKTLCHTQPSWLLVGWLLGWLGFFYCISTFVGYSMLNPFLYK